MELLDLYDSARDRLVPVALYPPRGASRGTLLFSVGFGGERTGYAYLARHWALAGWEVLVVEHVGSNLETLKPLRRPGQSQAELLRLVQAAVQDPEERQARQADLQFVHAHRQVSGLWGLAGHSYGAWTVLKSAPQLQPAGVLAISPPAPETFPDYARVTMPTLLVTGTLDDYTVEATARMRGLEALPPGPVALAVLTGADHMSFAGIGLNVRPIMETVQALTLNFWEDIEAGRKPGDPALPGVEWRQQGTTR